MQPGEFAPAALRPRLFGQGDRELRGVPKIIVVQQPAAGADWSYVIGGPVWYKLHAIVGQLVTSATVAARSVAFTVKYTGILCAQFGATATQAASLTVVYSFADTSVLSADPGTIHVPTTSDMVFKDAITIGTRTASIQAADQWSAIALYVEEFTDRCLDL
jgi:hypothetical protein